MTGFVFKVQANMDPNHRDRIAFVRLCSGKLTRGMKVKQVRTGKIISLQAPQFFFAQDRALAEEAHAGDVVGIPNHGTLRIGDTLTEGEELNFVGVPSFAPEILRRVRLPDAMKAKKLKQALQEMAEEGVVQVFRPTDGSPALVGVVGPLQLDVLRVRLADEYGLEVDWDTAEFQLARWIAADDGRARWLRRRAPLGDRRGPRRRSRLPGAQRLQSRLHAAGKSRHRVHRREGHPRPQQGGVRICHHQLISWRLTSALSFALEMQSKLATTHSSGANLKLRRAAAVARSSRRVLNSTLPSTILKSRRWMRPQSQHCSRKFFMRGRVHSP